MDLGHNSTDSEQIVLTAMALMGRGCASRSRTFAVERLHSLYNRSELTLIHLDERGLLTRTSDYYSLFSSALAS
jgi:hypothetical protein